MVFVAKPTIKNLSNSEIKTIKELKNEGMYDLKVFMERLFALNFPSPWSSLDIAFRELRQGDSSIIEYSRKFRLFVTKLDLNIKEISSEWR